MKFLDSTGLGVLWNKIKSSFLSLNGGGTIKNNSDSNRNIEIYADDGDSSAINIYGSGVSKNKVLASLSGVIDAGSLILSYFKQSDNNSRITLDSSFLDTDYANSEGSSNDNIIHCVDTEGNTIFGLSQKELYLNNRNSNFDISLNGNLLTIDTAITTEELNEVLV